MSSTVPAISKRRIELKQRLRPEFAFGQLGFYYLLDLWVGNLEKTADVVLVVRDDPGVSLENVHRKSLLALGWLFLLS